MKLNMFLIKRTQFSSIGQWCVHM